MCLAVVGERVQSFKRHSPLVKNTVEITSHLNLK